MRRSDKRTGSRPALFIRILVLVAFMSGWAQAAHLQEARIQAGWKNITEASLMATVRELCSEKYAGRLTGTKGYDDAAAWVAGRLAGWGLRPGGDNGGYFQEFPNPYTLVLPGAELSLQATADQRILKTVYEIESDFFPGST